MATGFKRFLKTFSSLFITTKEKEGTAAEQKIGRGAYAITLPSAFKHIGEISVSIPLHSEESGRFPRSTVHSKVFSDKNTILFVQRISAPVANTYFAPLTGEEFDIWGKRWRKNRYALTVDETTKEFNAYCTFITDMNLSTRSSFLIEMLDRRISPTSILRVVAFTSDSQSGLPSVPEPTSRYSVRSNK